MSAKFPVSMYLHQDRPDVSKLRFELSCPRCESFSVVWVEWSQLFRVVFVFVEHVLINLRLVCAVVYISRHSPKPVCIFRIYCLTGKFLISDDLHRDKFLKRGFFEKAVTMQDKDVHHPWHTLASLPISLGWCRQRIALHSRWRWLGIMDAIQQSRTMTDRHWQIHIYFHYASVFVVIPIVSDQQGCQVLIIAILIGARRHSHLDVHPKVQGMLAGATLQFRSEKYGVGVAQCLGKEESTFLEHWTDWKMRKLQKIFYHVLSGQICLSHNKYNSYIYRQ